MAGTLARGFEEAYSTLLRLEDSKADNGRIPTVDERMQLSYDIFKIDNTEMARVLTIIETACPSALSRKVRQHSLNRALRFCMKIESSTIYCFVISNW